MPFYYAIWENFIFVNSIIKRHSSKFTVFFLLCNHVKYNLTYINAYPANIFCSENYICLYHKNKKILIITNPSFFRYSKEYGQTMKKKQAFPLYS